MRKDAVIRIGWRYGDYQVIRVYGDKNMCEYRLLLRWLKERRVYWKWRECQSRGFMHRSIECEHGLPFYALVSGLGRIGVEWEVLKNEYVKWLREKEWK